MAKQKRLVQSKEDVVRVLNVKRQQAFIRNDVFPALIAATRSVDEARMLTQALTSVIMEEAMKVLKEKKVSDIREVLIERLCEGERIPEIRAMLLPVDNETLFDTRAIFEGLKSVIEQLINDEMKDRALDSFKVDWDRMMTK